MALRRPVSEAAAEVLGRRLWLLGQPVRIRLVECLERRGELSVGELAAELGVSHYDCSQHLALLRRDQVVRRRQHGRSALYRLVDRDAVAIYERAALALVDQLRGLDALREELEEDEPHGA